VINCEFQIDLNNKRKRAEILFNPLPQA